MNCKTYMIRIFNITQVIIYLEKKKVINHHILNKTWSFDIYVVFLFTISKILNNT
jgi:hypothetical protein